MALKITSFPIITVDNQATEQQEGLCPILSANIPILSGTSTSAVVSEFGIRTAIDNYCNNAVSGISLGTGLSIFSNYNYNPEKQVGTVSLKSLKINNPRYNINLKNNNIEIDYNGKRIITTILNKTTEFVQGGKYQIFTSFESLSAFKHIILG